MIYLVSAMLFYQFALLLWLIYGARKLSDLRDTSVPQLESSLPSLSIIVPARNEEKTIEKGLTSLGKLSYPSLEIFVINDRSTDRTGEMIERFAANDSRFKPISVSHLPPDWLGKNHALHLGAQFSKSELLLFTDADVEIDDVFLRKAVVFFNNKRLDHLGAIPRVTSRDWKVYPLLGVFGLAFSLFTRPWQGKDPLKDRAVGIGAFNLVRKTSYDAFAGHESLRLRPDDDLKLALLMKRSGLKTDCIKGLEGLTVEWYSSIGELKRGLEKNVMTGFEYSFSKAVLGHGLFFMTFLLPFLLPFFSSGPAFFISCLSLGLLLASYFGQLYEARMPVYCTPLFPLASAVILGIFTRACWLTFRNDGVYWRDTFYSLEKLRTNLIPPPGSLKTKTK